MKFPPIDPRQAATYPLSQRSSKGDRILAEQLPHTSLSTRARASACGPAKPASLRWSAKRGVLINVWLMDCLLLGHCRF